MAKVPDVCTVANFGAFINDGRMVGFVIHFFHRRAAELNEFSQSLAFSAITLPSHFSALKFYTVSMKLLSTLLNNNVPMNNEKTIKRPE